MELITLLIILITIFTSAYLYFKYIYSYWARRNIPHLKPSFPNGNLDSLLPTGIAIGMQTTRYYNEFKKMNVKYGGVYAILQPMLVIMDLDLVKDILIKDFQYFMDRGVYHNEKSDPLSSNLFSQDTQKWKTLRVKFTPTFTSGKIKSMSKTVANIAKHMVDYIENQSNKNELFIKNVTQGYTIDVIGSTVFGIECNSLKDTQTEFRRMAFRIFDVGAWLASNLCLALYWPSLGRKLGARTTNYDVSKFFYKLVKDNVHYRETNNIIRPDFFNSLIELKNKENKKEGLTMEEVTSQALLFFSAGFETSASTMIYCLYELSKNPEIQERVRQDILRGLEANNGELDYDAVKDMKFLQQAVEETLRMYPLLSTLTRKAVRDYKIRGTNDVIEKGTTVLLPVFGIQRDPEIWHDPLTFDPERFNDENKKNIHTAAHLPFGDGPRNCIGMRFGIMQVKIGLSVLLSNYKFSLSPKTKEPIEFNKLSFILFSIQDIFLKAEKIN